MIEATQATPVEDIDFFDVRQSTLDLEEFIELLLIFHEQETAF